MTSQTKDELRWSRWKLWRPHLATLVMLAVVCISAAVVGAWFFGQGTISEIFSKFDMSQANPPIWLEVPRVTTEYLLVPTMILLVVVFTVMKVSPHPQQWSRFVVIGILSVLVVRYLMWRSLSTLNLSTPLNGVFSLGLFFLELLILGNGCIQLLLMLNVRDRHHEANVLSQDIIDGHYRPWVDILIPTYDEPNFILQRTIIGCQALDYDNKTIYLLDDTQRDEVKILANQLGCEYISRSDNRHAKAGNLNHAIAKTHGELIVVFDADFVPTKNFLIRTIGFFQDPKVGLIQTPQSFYNPDPIARNLGLEDVLTSEEEVFYRQIQPMRDGAGGVVCSGTSFVVRRSALQTTGGFVTESLSEDYFTGIRLAAQGYRLVYLDEKLSAGLAAENISSQAIQRIRWARGTLQAFFIKSNPLTISGLRPIQRLAYLEGLLHWFTSVSRVGFLLMPLAYSFLGVIPLRATPAELLYFFLPYYLLQLAVFAWLNYRSRSALLSDIYSLVLCFPLALTAIQSMLIPFGKGFRVTPKGTASDRYSFNWALAWPLIIMFVATAVSLWINLGLSIVHEAEMANLSPEAAEQMKHQMRGFDLGWIWSAYNLIMLSIALLILLDVPRPTIYDWFDLRRTVCIRLGDRTFWGITRMISEIGVDVELTQASFPPLAEGESIPVTLNLLEEDLTFRGQAIQTGHHNEFPTVRIRFEDLTLKQRRALVEMLFCRPGQWKSRCTPGELQSLLILFKILLKPRVIFDRDVDVRPVAVSKV
ncbi:MAG: glycosyltransferase family 2 protein [Elainellaceae cyanobacterium]